MITWLRSSDPFPPPSRALRDPNGLLAAGADLAVPRLLDAYRRGIFPWYSEGEPVLWWSPDPRMILVPGRLVVSRSLRKRLRRRDYAVRADTSFEAVMGACAEPRQGQAGTWISPEMIRAYVALHQAGYAHSVETWQDGVLAGGLYGVSMGRVFFGESTFARRSDASKVALVHLVRQLKRWSFGMIDCQMSTPHLESLGAREIARTDFMRALQELVNYPTQKGPWRFDDDLPD
jgi:leucyl/phenylalanyl-tRNA---protein transferase